MIVLSRSRAVLVALSLFAFAGCSAEEPPCPDFVAKARTLLVVTAAGMDDPAATLQIFQREDVTQDWQTSAPPEAAVVGEKGVAWGYSFRHLARGGEPAKTEGDRRTPAGIFALGPTFGAEAAEHPGHLRLRKGEHICVDDPASPHYSRIVPRSIAGVGTRGEEMADYPVYVRGIVVDYPTSREAQAGSCIFIHVWERPGEGTAGCVAAPETLVARLQRLAASGDAALAIVPANARDRVARCLPKGANS